MRMSTFLPDWLEAQEWSPERWATVERPLLPRADRVSLIQPPFWCGKRVFVWCSRRRSPRPTLTRLHEAPPRSSTDYWMKARRWGKIVVHHLTNMMNDRYDDYLMMKIRGSLLVLVDIEAIARQHCIHISPWPIHRFLQFQIHFFVKPTASFILKSVAILKFFKTRNYGKSWDFSPIHTLIWMCSKSGMLSPFLSPCRLCRMGL